MSKRNVLLGQGEFIMESKTTYYLSNLYLRLKLNVSANRVNLTRYILSNRY